MQILNHSGESATKERYLSINLDILNISFAFFVSSAKVGIILWIAKITEHFFEGNTIFLIVTRYLLPPIWLRYVFS